MAEAYLGPEFDIHGGGIDLVFPHHENEIAQSRAAGDPFARYWLHNGWVTTAGEKMSKSLGNSLLVSEVVKRVRPVELRYYLVAAHYRSHMEYSDAALAEASTSLRRVEGFLERAAERLGTAAPAEGTLPERFVAALDDDLGVPAALAVLHDAVREGNRLLDSRDDHSAELADVRAAVKAMAAVLGVDPTDPSWSAAGTASSDGRLRTAVDTLVGLALQQRQDARARKDYAAADAIRNSLAAAGIAVEDTPQGSRWSLGTE
jgi:cysteinyl-tRNA synthetase